jgi:hypothetical protein
MKFIVWSLPKSSVFPFIKPQNLGISNIKLALEGSESLESVQTIC